MPANKGFCGAGGGAGGAGTDVPIPPQPQLKVGDRIVCYITKEHADKRWEVTSTITAIDYVKGSSGQEFFNGCEVEYRHKGNKQTARIAGGDVDWLLRKA